jgi:predicted lipoprotein with Yx(FWY)xxD motif
VKRINLLLVSALLVALAATVSSVALARSGTSAARASLFHTVELRKTKLGKILVASSGYTLYAFSKDSRGKDACAKIKGCLEAWPAKEAQGKPSGGPGVRASLLSTVKLPTGETQVAYAGHPLYIYADDSGPGQTSYVGVKQFGGTWSAVNAAGHLVK